MLRDEQSVCRHLLYMSKWYYNFEIEEDADVELVEDIAGSAHDGGEESCRQNCIVVDQSVGEGREGVTYELVASEITCV